VALWSNWSQNARCGGCIGIALLLLIASLAAADGSDTATCTELQRASVTVQAPWRCVALLEPGRSYLVRVDRQSVDVTLELVAPDSRHTVKVDSPTRRAGPELLLYRAPVRGEHTLIVSTLEHGVPAAAIEVQLREVSGVAPGSPLGRGLAALTSSASGPGELDPSDALRRVELLRGALPDLIARGARDLEAEARFRIAAMHYWILNDWTSAATTAQEAMQAFNRLGNSTMSAHGAVIRAASLTEMAGTIRRRGAHAGEGTARVQFEEARRLLEGAAERFRAADMTYDEAHALNYLGVAAQYEGRPAEARTRYLAAAKLFESVNETTSRVLPLQNVAVLDYEGGEYARAIASYQGLLKQLDPQSDASNYVAILNNLGSAQYVVGNTDDALNVLSTALSLTAEDAIPADRARTLHALGRTYLIVGDTERGAVFLEQALELRRTLGDTDRRGLLISLLRNGDLQRERGFAADALKLHLQALDYALSPQEKTRVLLAAGLDQMARGNVDGAIDMYRRALEFDLPSDWPARVSVSGAYGYALMRKGDPQGRALLTEAAKAHENAGDDELAAQDHYLLASEDWRAGRHESALRSVEKALALYESQRIRALNPDLRATYVSTRSAVYELQAEALMSLAERAPDVATRQRLQSSALLAAESLRVRALNDFRDFAQSPSEPGDGSAADTLLALDSRLAAKRHRLSTVMDLQNPSAETVASLRRDIALLQTELDIEQARQRQPRRDAPFSQGSSSPSLAQLQRSIAPDSVVMTWLLGESRSWVWCLTREHAVAYPLAGRRDVEQAARQLYSSWSQPTASPSRAESEASRVILGPSGQMLAGKRKVVAVADGLLRAIPIGALYLADATGAGRRVAETHEVSYRPSLSHWSATRAMPPRGENAPRILLVGDPMQLTQPATTGGQSMRGVATAESTVEFPRLPGSRREVAGIVRLASGWQSDVLLGEEATKAAVLAEPLDQFRVLHFATHARLDVRDPQLSALVLSGPRAGHAVNQSALSLREIVAMDLNADAVVLSACEGSLGKDYRGQLSFGLSEAFLLAGSRSVLGSLWRVSDAATERYMQAFYEHYLGGEFSVVEAAQSAARTMMRDPMFNQPYFWAAFVVLNG
jgi:CHAT domain-containing protein/Flp pilus assembly protein TadD